MQMLLEEIISFNKELNYSVIICGDLNAAPDALVYNFLTKRDFTNQDIYRLLLPRDHGSDKINHLNVVVNESLKGNLWNAEKEMKLTESDKKRLQDAEK